MFTVRLTSGGWVSAIAAVPIPLSYSLDDQHMRLQDNQ